jgi:hypothetical protein
MKTRPTWLFALPLLSALSVAQADGPNDPRRPAQAPSAAADTCTVASPLARYEAYAYTHVVELKNNCTRPVTCEVWTDVDPTPHHVLSAKPGESASVLVRRGSPARTFKAEKSCKY